MIIHAGDAISCGLIDSDTRVSMEMSKGGDATVASLRVADWCRDAGLLLDYRPMGKEKGGLDRAHRLVQEMEEEEE